MTDAERLDRIEAILRDQRMHEPTCPIRHQQRLNRAGGIYWHEDRSVRLLAQRTGNGHRRAFPPLTWASTTSVTPRM